MLTNASNKFNNFGLFILRVGIGAIFVIYHGWDKIMDGPDRWEKLGHNMSNLGINFLPTFWGFMAAFAEFGGGILLILGLFTRPAAFLMAFTMLVAVLKSMAAHNSFTHPLEMLAVFTALIFLGAGKWSLDARIRFKK